MRTVTITIESSEGPVLTLKKTFRDGQVEVQVARGGDSPTRFVPDTHDAAVNEMVAAASRFIREIA